MKQRGRKSADSVALERFSSAAVERPDAPYQLDDEQSVVWMRVVEDLPADWFTPKNYDMLVQYCRHVVAAQRVAQLIACTEKQDEIDVEEYDRLLKMQEREGRAISSLATRMRITQQSEYSDRKTRTPKGRAVSKPWQS